MAFTSKEEELLCELSRSGATMQRKLLQAEGAQQALATLITEGCINVGITTLGWQRVQETNRRIVREGRP